MNLHLFRLVLLCHCCCGVIYSCTTSKPVSGSSQEKTDPSGNIRQIALDQLGQLYVVDSNNELIQYRPNGDIGFNYNNNTLGRLGLIDTSNPFSLLLYYPDFQTIILLDRTLNERSRLVLRALKLLDIEHIALNNDNFIWLYDAADIQLKKLNQNGVIGVRSDQLNLLLGKMPNPTQLLAMHNRVILNDPEIGIFIFDQFGRYETTLPVLGAESLQMPNDQNLFYQREGKLYGFNLRSLQENPLPLEISCKLDCQLRIGKEKVYWLEKGVLKQKELPKSDK